MKIEDILKKLIEANEYEVSQLYPDGRKLLLEYIVYLQRKEYNNSKAIEYGKELRLFDNESLEFEIGTNFINILEKGE